VLKTGLVITSQLSQIAVAHANSLPHISSLSKLFPNCHKSSMLLQQIHTKYGSLSTAFCVVAIKFETRTVM